MIEKGGEPSPAGGVVDRAIREMRNPRLGIGQQRAFVATRGPAAHHGVGHVRMKLQREGGATVTKGLHRERVAFRKQVGAERQVEALAMPLIDLLGPRIAHRAADLGRTDWIVADLGMTIGMSVDTAAEMMRQHLRAETDAEKRLRLLERTLSQSISRRMNSSVSFALIGPPKIMAPVWAAMVPGSGSPKRGRRTSSA